MSKLELMLLRLLATIVAAGLLAGGGYHYGKRAERNAQAVRQRDAATAAIDKANLDIEVTAQANYETGLRNARLASRARQLELEGQLDAANKSRPECAWDSGSLGLLNDAIDAANDRERAAGGVPTGLRGNTEAGGRIGAGNSGLGIRLNLGGGAVQEIAQRLRAGDGSPDQGAK